MNAWLIYNSGLINKKFSDIHQWYVNSAAELGINLNLVPNDSINVGVIDSQLKLDHQYPEPQFILFLDKDIRLAYQLEALGYQLFNGARSIEVCDDKILMHQELTKRGLRQPNTRFSPKLFHEATEVKEETLHSLEDTLGYPMIIKESFGSFGKQVYKVDNREALRKRATQLLHIPHLYQQYIYESSGKDIRLQVVGDRVVVSVKRVNLSDFRANVTNGGQMEPVEVNDEYKRLAVEASLAVGADFSGVDLLVGSKGEPIICEVNSNAHIKNIYDCTGIDVSIDLFQHIKANIQ